MLTEREQRIVMISVIQALKLQPEWVLKYMFTKGEYPPDYVIGMNIAANTLRGFLEDGEYTEGVIEEENTREMLRTILDKLEEHEVQEEGCEGLKN